MIDPYQIWLARYYQADAILLMLSVLDDQQYLELAAVADRLGMGILTEVSNPQELSRALSLKAKVIGINNRDLRDLPVDLDKTRQLAPQVPQGTRIICESGINDYAQIQDLRRYADGFLVGSSLMSEPDLRFAVKRLLSGENKVCGLTRPADALASYQAGAVYGGLIFAEDSPRQVSLAQARQVMTGAPLRYVGVFRNQSRQYICEVAHQLKLSAVQLHGDEDPSFIGALRTQLPTECAIWKAFTISDSLPALGWTAVDRYLFDQGKGGCGQPFNWDLLEGAGLTQVILAGGLTPDNCQQAARLGCAGLDLNSGIESALGIKDHAKISAAFARINTY